jgi:hypothetical protein
MITTTAYHPAFVTYMCTIFLKTLVFLGLLVVLLRISEVTQELGVHL